MLACFNQIVPLLSEGELSENKLSFWGKLTGSLHQIVEELMAPPTVAAVSFAKHFS